MQVRRKILVTAVAVSLTVGIILGAVLSSNLLVTRSLSSSADSKNQALTISGTETIKVLAPDGRVLSTWQGPDPLSSNTQNAIAGCATGLSQPSGSVPSGVFGSCESWIGSVALWTDAPGGTCTVFQTSNSKDCTYYNPVAATNTLTPIGCTTGSATAYGTCTGWITDATFGPTTFTSTNCGSACGVEEVIGGSPISNGGAWAFDTLCASTFAPNDPSIGCMTGSIATVAPQDSLLVTIAFSIS